MALVQGIPFLSSIPILGGLFRYTSETVTKKELVIIITPHVVVSNTEGENLTSEFVGKLREVKQYLEEKDIEYFTGISQIWIKTLPGTFGIFFPEDVHAPMGSVEVKSPSRV